LDAVHENIKLRFPLTQRNVESSYLGSQFVVSRIDSPLLKLPSRTPQCRDIKDGANYHREHADNNRPQVFTSLRGHALDWPGELAAWPSALAVADGVGQ
jgi:hypothetical protein